MSRVSLIAAVDDSLGIGKDNDLPWHIPEDFRWFKAKTLRKPIVMGRATHESIGKILPGRENIVLSRDTFYTIDHPNAPVLSNFDEIFWRYEDAEEIVIIGGAQIYKLAMPVVDRMYLTRVDGSYDCDTFFPDIDYGEWELTFSEDFASNKYYGTFQIFDRKWRNK